jgi:hypothetical protein
MVFKAAVESIGATELRLRLRAPQRNASVLPLESRYAIEHDHIDTPYHSMFRGLAAYLSAPPARRALLTGCRAPASDYIEAENPDALDRIVAKARAASDYFLLVGPPGTGKTSFALRSMVEAFVADGKQILLMAYTNRAVDEICKVLEAMDTPAEYIRMGSEPTADMSYRARLLDNVLEHCTRRADVQQTLHACRIYVGTVATLALRTELFRLKRFDVAIVDEATQILEPALLGLLCGRRPSGDNAIGKFILIGDHKQLPAIVAQSDDEAAVNEPSLQALGFRSLKESLFQRLYRAARNGLSPSADSPVCDMLCRQGRMHPDVARFANRFFYGGQLRSLDLAHQTEPSPVPRVCFFPSTADPEFVKHNRSEALIVGRLAYRLYIENPLFDPRRSVGIIAPYRNQIALIRQELHGYGVAALDEIVVDTVERFQGSERDVIIYSFCLNRAEQLPFLCNLTEEDGVPIDRKLNVAVTRARARMYLVGDPALLALNPLYRALMEECEG